MKDKIVTIKLPEGDFETTVLQYDESDKKRLYAIYTAWRSLCDNLNAMKSRAVNIPEGLSEAAFCMAMGAVRITTSISGANSSFDCFDLKTNKRIQVKATSIHSDLTSFGPKSEWDLIYFLDFYRNGAWDGTFDIYLIDNADVYNHKVNENQTVKDQQKQGRRPRFSIIEEIIRKKSLKPVKTYNLKK